jgi:hypothetical protein
MLIVKAATITTTTSSMAAAAIKALKLMLELLVIPLLGFHWFTH